MHSLEHQHNEDMAAEWSAEEEESDFARGLRHELSLRLAAPVLKEGGSDCLDDAACIVSDNKSNRDEAKSDASVRSDTLPVDVSELQDELERAQEERTQVRNCRPLATGLVTEFRICFAFQSGGSCVEAREHETS